MTVILASKSPRRVELIKKICPNARILSEDVDEDLPIKPYMISKEISKAKAYEVFKSHPNDVVIAADTIVTFDDIVYGKPKSEEEAFHMLKALSGKTHLVITGYTIISSHFEI